MFWNENSSVGSMGLHVNFLPPFLHTYMVMNCSKHMTTKYSTLVCSCSSSSTVIISNLYNIIKMVWAMKQFIGVGKE